MEKDIYAGGADSAGKPWYVVYTLSTDHPVSFNRLYHAFELALSKL